MGEDTEMSAMWEKTLHNGKLIWEGPVQYGFCCMPTVLCYNLQTKYEVLVWMWMAALFAAVATYRNLRFWKDGAPVSEGQKPSDMQTQNKIQWCWSPHRDTHDFIHKQREPGSCSLAINISSSFTLMFTQQKAQGRMRFVKEPFRDGDFNFISTGSNLFLDTQI